MLILNSQKSQIHLMIIDAGLEPSMFKWEGIQSRSGGIGKVSQLSYTNTDYFFKFDFLVTGSHRCEFSPGINSRFTEDTSRNWQNQIINVRKWLLRLRKEIETVDPWDDIDKYMPGVEINLEDEKENSPFSYQTVEHITNALHKLKDKIRESYNLDTDQDKLVQEKLDYLIDCSKKMGRKDWYHIFIGAFIGLAFKLDFTPEQAKGLWDLFKVCLKGIGLLEG